MIRDMGNDDSLTSEVTIEDTEEPEPKLQIPLSDLNQDELDELKKSIINTVSQMYRVELDQLWSRLQHVEAKAEINTNSNETILSVVRNHVHEPIPPR